MLSQIIIFCGNLFFDTQNQKLLRNPYDDPDFEVPESFVVNVVFWQVTDDEGYLPTHFPEKVKITYKRGTEIIKQLNHTISKRRYYYR